jgi:stromal membrane-associated protein
MGTHISRVKSVDLDAWTDEQLQSVVQWGNSRANKSVEAATGRFGLIKPGTGKQSWPRDMFHQKRMVEFP